MKRIMLTATFLSAACGLLSGQNLLKHFHDVRSGIRFEAATNQYILRGTVAPALLSGMDNTGPSGPLSRIQLQLLDDQLNTLWASTYATQTEVARATSTQGVCHKLTNAFYTSDAHRTADGGYIICGASVQSSEISGCAVPYFEQGFLLKVNSTGGVMWYKRYDGVRTFSAVEEDQLSGRLIACGGGGAVPTSVGVIVCTNATGNVLWSKYSQASLPGGGPGAALSTRYEKIRPFLTSGGQSCYALVGNADQNGMGMDGGILISIIDINGIFYRDAVFTQGGFYRFPSGFDIADAGSGKVLITGSSIDASGGYPCGIDNGTLILLRMDPMTFVADLFRSYRKLSGSFSWGSGLSVWRNGPVVRYCVTGGNTDGRAIYLETDDNGNVMRYTLHDGSQASSGNTMTINTLASYPTYAGGYSGGAFALRNNYGMDCEPDLLAGIEELPYSSFVSDHNTYPVTAIAEVMQYYPLAYSESVGCGMLKPGATGIAGLNGGESILVSPNPATTMLQVQSPDGELQQVSVYDLRGRLLLQKEVTAPECRIDLQVLSPGIYMLQALDQEGRTRHSRFVKE